MQVRLHAIRTLAIAYLRQQGRSNMRWLLLFLAILPFITTDPACAAGLEPLKLAFWSSPLDATESAQEEFDVCSPHDFAPEVTEVRVSLLNTGSADIAAAFVFVSISPFSSVLVSLDEDGNVNAFRTRIAGVKFPSLAVGPAALRDMGADGRVETASVRGLPLGNLMRQLNAHSPGYCFMTEVEGSVFVLPRIGAADLSRCVMSRCIPFKHLDHAPGT